MPVRPPVYTPNNALPILPKIGPAIYRPNTVQLKPVHPAAPPVYKPNHALPVLPKSARVSSAPSALMQRLTIQRSKGVEGGKAGLGYGDVGGGDQEENRQALQRAGLKKGVKGHKKGKKGSGVSGQTKKETKQFVDARREIREERKAQVQQCRQFHKRKNLGAECPSCRNVVTQSMI